MKNLEKVKKDGFQYVGNQTDEICLTSVKERGLTLRYLKNVGKDIPFDMCLEAVKNNEDVLEFCSEEFKKWYSEQKKIS
jgi:hypothetical protein